MDVKDEKVFDLYGDLEDLYDEAEENGDVEIMETLDIFGLWKAHHKCSGEFMRKIWNALQGDVDAQTDVGYAFYWSDEHSDEVRAEHKWMDKPHLAMYWFKLAAKYGHAVAQNYLARLYCPDQEPFGALKVGRLSRYWLEKATAQKLPVAMENLALCLKCGKCPCCDSDIPRAKSLESEARLPKMRKHTQSN